VRKVQPLILFLPPSCITQLSVISG
jgi:hypothetical protein